VDVASTFTPLGKLVLLLDIQVGAIGVMTFSYFVLMMVGKRLAVRDSMSVSGMLDQQGVNIVPSLLRAVFFVTLTAEAVGAPTFLANTARELFRLALNKYPATDDSLEVVRVYEDLSGNVRLEEVIETDIETNINGSLGGWQIAESTEAPDDVKAVISDSGLVPVAVSATQVVSGTNYCVFCQSDPSAPDLKDMFCVAYVYKDLNGNAEITDTVNFGINE
jgi:hypothetical protein